LFKHPGKIKLVLIARHHADFADGVVRYFHKFAGLVYPVPDQKFLGARVKHAHKDFS
jgi:hypothetical protein